MAEDKNIQCFGYTEMYEWAKVPKKRRFGLFVQFNKHYPSRIEPYFDTSAQLAGVSTICSVLESDNPEQWKYTYMCNEIGDLYLREETLAVGIKQYDQEKEFSYISTRPWKHYVKIPNKAFDPNKQYVPRVHRQEWTRVTMLGKTIVYDNGEVEAGSYCMPYSGDDAKQMGTAVPWDGKSKCKFYVLERITDNTVLIVVNAFDSVGNAAKSSKRKISSKVENAED